MLCGGSAELADGISSMASSVVGPWGMMTDDVGADVGIGMDFCRLGCASASVKALRFAWASATVGWGASALVGCEA